MSISKALTLPAGSLERLSSFAEPKMALRPCIYILGLWLGTLLVVAQTQAAVTNLNPIDDATASDFGPQDGIFDQLITSGDQEGSVNNNGFTSFRSAFEFDLSALPAHLTINSATLTLRGRIFEGPRQLQLHGYVGDGTVGLGDFAVDGLAAARTVQPIGDQDVVFDVRSFVASFLAGGNTIAGFNLREEPANAPNFTIMFFNMTGQPGPPPTLSIDFTVKNGLADKKLNSRLRGDYAFTWTRVCVQATASRQTFGVNPLTPQVPAGGATTRTSTIKGVFTYNGDGTGSATGTEFQIFHNMIFAGQFPIAQQSFTADLVYTVNPDGSFTQELLNYNSTVLAGLPVLIGTMFTTEGIHMEGHIAPNRQVLLLGDVTPNREMFSGPAVMGGGVVLERICGRSGNAIKARRSED